MPVFEIELRVHEWQPDPAEPGAEVKTLRGSKHTSRLDWEQLQQALADFKLGPDILDPPPMRVVGVVPIGKGAADRAIPTPEEMSEILARAVPLSEDDLREMGFPELPEWGSGGFVYFDEN